jgi:hypothetical protein
MLAMPGLISRPLGAQPGQPPHAWVFGAWTGGQFPPGDIAGPECFGSPTVIFTRELVLRATALDLTFRQRAIETVVGTPNGLEFRLAPLTPTGGPMGGRLPPDYGFGCDGNPDLLRVERRGPDEISFPGCSEFPSPLRRCLPARQ